MTHGIALASSHNGFEPKRPSLLRALGEFRAPLEATVFWLNALSHPFPHAEPGRGKVVMLIPGFMAGDVTLAPMASFCRWLGHQPNFTGIWSNSNCPRDTIRLAAKRLGQLYDRHGVPIVLIGQSLGGVYARELAQRHPEMIERAITLGSPIRRPRHHANAAVAAVARSVAALRGKAEGCLTESCACGLEMIDKGTEVPTTVVYSRTDGVVHWEGCVDVSGLPTVENVEVMGSHVGMAVSPDVYRIIADRLALDALPRRAQRHTERRAQRHTERRAALQA